MTKILFLVSGNGGNMKFFHKCIEKKIINNIELYAIGDRDCDAIEYAKANNIYSKVISYNKEEGIDEIQNLIDQISPDIIFTTFHKIIDQKTVNKYRDKLINLHYSMLPLYKGSIGISTVIKAIKDGCKFVGCTIHRVNEDVDSGEIIMQAVVKSGDDIEKTMNDVFRMGCLSLLEVVIRNQNKSQMINNGLISDKYFFNPPLSYDVSKIDGQLWDEIR